MRPWNKKRQETYGLGLATIILLVLPKKSHEKRQYFPVHWTLWNVLRFYYSRMIQVAFKGVYLGGHWASGRGEMIWFDFLPFVPIIFPSRGRVSTFAFKLLTWIKLIHCKPYTFPVLVSTNGCMFLLRVETVWFYDAVAKFPAQPIISPLGQEAL